MKVVAVLLAAVMVIGALVELLCQTSMAKNVMLKEVAVQTPNLVMA